MSEDSILIVNYCVSDEKDSRKHVYIVYFSCIDVLGRRKKKMKFTANAALNTKYKRKITFGLF